MDISTDIYIRKVKVLGDRIRKQADEMGLDEDDLVIVRTKINDGLPEYDLEKITGNPIEYLQRNLS